MHQAHDYLRILAAWAVLAPGIALSTAPGVLAHARLVNSVPAANSEVREAPKRLELKGV
jgi:methionine-rich copper-binding protein CopC